jgi:hypothetical protein
VLARLAAVDDADADFFHSMPTAECATPNAECILNRTFIEHSAFGIEH